MNLSSGQLYFEIEVMCRYCEVIAIILIYATYKSAYGQTAAAAISGVLGSPYTYVCRYLLLTRHLSWVFTKSKAGTRIRIIGAYTMYKSESYDLPVVSWTAIEACRGLIQTPPFMLS